MVGGRVERHVDSIRKTLAPRAPIERDRQTVPIVVVEVPHVVIAAQVVKPAVRGGDDGDPRPLRRKRSSQVPQVYRGAALDQAVIEPAALEVRLDDVHGQLPVPSAAFSKACRNVIAA